jgi:type I restriction enzyme M protein
MSISTTIKAIQDIMRQDAGVDGDAQRISQLTWLLFLKIFDDREQEYELDSAYQSPIPAKLRWRSWAANEEGITGDDLLQFVDGKLFPSLKNQEKMLASDNPRARLEYVRKEYVKSDADRKVSQTSIRGIEKKPLPHLLATTNLILHDVEVPQVWHDNALTRRPYKDYDEADQVDVILTNPPFGGMEEPGVEQNFPSQFQTKETADLFLAMIVKLLKDKGGKGAIVLPDGSLFGEGIKTRLKEHLLATCNLHTVVRLPKGVFNPYTGINTNLLFFTKGEPTKEVWYFEHPTPADRKNYSKTRPIDIKEFDLEKAWWDERVENEHAWCVTIEEIKARNYNLDIKNPSTVDAAHGDPVLMLEKYRKHQEEIANLRASIKSELESALK